jgi:hypothetical protein
VQFQDAVKLNTKNLSRAAALILACAAPILAAGHIAADEAKSFDTTEDSIKADYSFTETSDDDSVTLPAGALSRPGSAITAYGNLDNPSTCQLIPVNARRAFCPGGSGDDGNAGGDTSVASFAPTLVAAPEPDGITLPLIAMVMLTVAVRRGSSRRESGR